MSKKLHSYTDLGNAERLVDLHGDRIRYCTDWHKWLIWNGVKWEVDTTDEIRRLAIDAVQAMKGDHYDDESTSHKHFKNSQSLRSINAMVELAKCVRGIPVGLAELDTQPMLLNCLNGTIDLTTGKLKCHNRLDLITKVAPVEYHPSASCPTWQQFIERGMGGNKNLVAFLNRAIGYTLTADISEQAMFMLFGEGANGKSTFLETIRSMLGDYAVQTDASTLLARKNDGIRNDIARLRGARFVTASEVDKNRALSEVTVKQLTGGDVITARRLYCEHEEFRVMGKIFLAANHKPSISSRDNGIWRRLLPIPFNVTIRPDERDPYLQTKLNKELNGILAWAIRGCSDWQIYGLNPPREVIATLNLYKNEMDSSSQFIDEYCTLKPEAKVAVGSLYTAYSKWCAESNESPMSKRAFGELLHERDIEQKRGTRGERYWMGIELIKEDTDIITAA